MSLASGSRLGAYDICGSLGAGGMGEVYRAHDPRLGRDVALKVLPADMASDPGRLERFTREARAIAALNHPHIVTIYSTEEADGIRFLTMELVEGQALDALIPATGLPLTRFLELALPLADALTAAHQKQITHRDLKPANVMVGGDGRVKVLDFGLARIGGSLETHHTIEATRAVLTGEGTIVGTMPYMSPEQIEGKPLDHRTDLFSLGVMFHEMLTGARPFTGESSPQLMSSILRDVPSSASDIRADIPEALSRLIHRCLEKRPDDRVQTARDIYNELKHVQKQIESGAARRPDTGSGAAKGLSDALWIAVLPFTTRGADTDGEALAAGLTEDITAGLSRFPSLSVVALQSARSFKDSPLDVRQIAERLNARYVMGGHVRKSASGIRIGAHLVDARSGAQLWTDTYDRGPDETDIYAVQDDVTDRVVSTVADKAGVLARSMAQAVRGRPLESATARQLVLRCLGMEIHPTPAEHVELRAALETYVARQPDDAHIWAELAYLYALEHAVSFNPFPDPLQRALSAARRAIELDPGHQEGWEMLAWTCFFLRDEHGLEEAAERAIKANPRNANTMARIGNTLTHKGEYDRGCQLTERAMALNAAHPGWYHFAPFNRNFARGEFNDAIRAARRVNIADFAWMHIAIAAAAGHLELVADGKAAAKALAALAPELDDEAILREFVTRWVWDEEVIESLLHGVRRSKELANAPDATAVPSRPPAKALAASGVTAKPASHVAARPAGAVAAKAAREDASIAVLPFVDLSPEKDQDWFCDGIAEEILNALTQLSGLHVAARTSAFSFRNQGEDLRTIAGKLGVATVLQGSVRRAGDRIRVTVQLVDVSNGFQLWSERYDRDLKDIFDVQDEIARAIAGRLKVTLAGGEDGRLVAKVTTNLEAYELLLKGRTLQTKRGRAILDALACFERAVALDPNLAEAHALLGDAYRLLALYGIAPATEMMPRARAAAERALTLDPNQVEALATLASITTVYDWDVAAGLAFSDRALAGDPSHVRTLAERAIVLTILESPPPDMVAGALHNVRRARELDPLSAWVAAIEGYCLALTGRPAEAAAMAHQAVALDADNFTAKWFLVWTLSANGRQDEAMAAAEPALAMSGRHPRILTEMAAIHAARGERAGADAIYNELRTRAGIAYIGHAEQGAAAAAAGRLDEARALVARAIEAREPYLVFWKLPAWAPFRQDAEGLSLLRGTGITRLKQN